VANSRDQKQFDQAIAKVKSRILRKAIEGLFRKSDLRKDILSSPTFMAEELRDAQLANLDSNGSRIKNLGFDIPPKDTNYEYWQTPKELRQTELDTLTYTTAAPIQMASYHQTFNMGSTWQRSTP
jgi:hypothetical protein